MRGNVSVEDEDKAPGTAGEAAGSPLSTAESEDAGGKAVGRQAAFDDDIDTGTLAVEPR
jgi:hypothetical protein